MVAALTVCSTCLVDVKLQAFSSSSSMMDMTGRSGAPTPGTGAGGVPPQEMLLSSGNAVGVPPPADPHALANMLQERLAGISYFFDSNESL